MRAIVFPGQGSQFVGMGKDLANSFIVAKRVFEEINDALNQDLYRIMTEGPEEELILTENAQPAIMAVGIAMIRVLKEEGYNINQFSNITSGHSLGEYTSLTAAESITLCDSSKLLKIRGQAMQNAVPKNKGIMAAVLGLNIDEVENALEFDYGGICEVANDNAKGQIVISGQAEAVTNAIEDLLNIGAKKVIKLPVSAPFHCSLMMPAKEKMVEELKKINLTSPLIPVISNFTAEPTRDTKLLKENLINQVDGMVRWREIMQKIVKLGFKEIVEFGSGSVLINLAKRNSPSLNRLSICDSNSLQEFIKKLS